jgi:ligand-binding sensor domain-containing protein
LATSGGLKVFDGASWTTYTKADGLPTHNLYNLAMIDNILYIATSEGLVEFKGNKFTTILDIPTTKITKDENNLYLATTKGFVTYNNGTYSIFNSPYILSLCNDIDKVLIGTNEGLYYFDKNTKEIKEYLIPDEFFPEVNAIAKDNQNLYIGYHYGLMINNEKIDLPEVKAIAYDSNYIFLGTDEGLYQLTINNYQLRIFNKDNSGLPSNKINSLAKEGDTIYIGTDLGLCSYKENNWEIYTQTDGLLSNNCLKPEKNKEKLFFATDKGLSIFYKETKEWKNYNMPSILSLKSIEPYLYIGTFKDGLFLLDYETGSLTNLSKENSIYALESYDTSLFLGTEKNLLLYNLNYGTITEIIPNISINDLFLKEETLSIATQYNGLYLYDILFGTITNPVTSTTIYCLNDEYYGSEIGLFKGTENLLSIPVYAIGELGNKLYLATNEGIIVYNKETKERETYTSRNTPIPSDEITGVIEDKGRLWFTLVGGVASLSYEKGFSFLKDIPIIGNEISGNLEIPLKEPGKYYIDSILSGMEELAKTRNEIYIYPYSWTFKITKDKKYYNPGETITLTLEISNLQSLISNLSLDLLPYKETLQIKANSTNTYTFTFKGTQSFYIEGYLEEIGIREYVIVEESVLDISLLSDKIVGKGTNTLRISLKNPTEKDIRVELRIANCELRIEEELFFKEKEEKIIEFPFSIIDDATFTLTTLGDFETTTTFPIIFGEKIEVLLLPLKIYKEGWIEIPFVVENKGSLPSQFELSFSLISNEKILSAIKGYISIRNKRGIKSSTLADSISLYILPAEKIEGSINYELKKGKYKISSSFFREKDLIEFRVSGENDARIVDMRLCDGGLLVDIENIGANDFKGEFSISSSFVATSTNINIPKEGTSTIKIEIKPSEGTYTIKGSLLYLGNVLDEVNKGFLFLPRFEPLIIQDVFEIGRTNTVTFIIKNKGMASGRRDVFFSIFEFTEKRELFLDIGNKGTISFVFFIDDDLSEGTYTGYIRIDNSLFAFPLYIKGWGIDVSFSLDKPFYTENENGSLSVFIKNKNGLSGTLTTIFRMEGDEKIDKFYISPYGSHTSIFNFQARFDKKIFFGIYTETGRGIWLDACYIRKKGDIGILLNKDVFKPGEEVLVEIEGEGTITLKTPGSPTEISLFLSSTKTTSFTLPQFIKSGTYYINWENNGKSGEVAFDVAGFEVLILGVSMDKGTYIQNEGFFANVKLLPSYPGTYSISYWLKDPMDGFYLLQKGDVFLPGREGSYFIKDVLRGECSGRYSLIVGVFKEEELLGIAREEFFLKNADIDGFRIDIENEWVEDIPLDIKIFGIKGSQTKAFFGKINIKGNFEIMKGFVNEGGMIIGSISLREGTHTIITSDGYFKGEKKIIVYPKIKSASFGSLTLSLDKDGYVKIKIADFSLYPRGDYIGLIYELSPIPLFLKASFTLRFLFDKNDVLNKGFNLNTIKAYYWDNGWVLSENQRFLDNMVIVETSHLSTWTLLGEKISLGKKNAIAYPNPWVYNKHREYGITFENLKPLSYLDIYNIGGERIFREVVGEVGKVVVYPNKLFWASGVYIWVCEDYEGKKIIGKIGIIK